MKLLKVFGIVAGIHVVALILIFANPGCSTTSKPRANPADTVMQPEASPVVSVPNLATAPAGDAASTQLNAVDSGSPIQPAPIAFNPDAPAEGASGRFSPTRPDTPVAKALQAEPVSDVVPVSTYTVARGDSLWSLAKKHGVSVADLAAANNLHGNSMLHIGQKLIIPGKAMASTTATAEKAPSAKIPAAKPAANGHAFTHVVKAGETLGAIARKYQVSVGDVATANNISDPAKIRPGQKLVIPGWKAPAARTQPKAEAAPAPAADTTKPAEPAASEPSIFTPPPSSQPLDEGLKPTAGAAPVIQVEDANAPQKN